MTRPANGLSPDKVGGRNILVCRDAGLVSATNYWGETLKKLSLSVTLVFLLVSCGGDGQEKATTETESAPSAATTSLSGGETANFHGSINATGKSDFAVELGDNYFDPTVLTGSAGQSLTLNLRNEGKAIHSFTLSDQGVDVDVPVAQSTTVKVTFPQSGGLVFNCKYHIAENMRGELRVK